MLDCNISVCAGWLWRRASSSDPSEELQELQNIVYFFKSFNLTVRAQCMAMYADGFTVNLCSISVQFGNVHRFKSIFMEQL